MSTQKGELGLTFWWLDSSEGQDHATRLRRRWRGTDPQRPDPWQPEIRARNASSLARGRTEECWLRLRTGGPGDESFDEYLLRARRIDALCESRDKRPGVRLVARQLGPDDFDVNWPSLDEHARVWRALSLGDVGFELNVMPMGVQGGGDRKLAHGT